MVARGNFGSTVVVRERHRWLPEEDALLLAYVRRYGARDWWLLPQRMGRDFLHPRDPKSCRDRWKNYLRPGLKEGSLSPDEQALLVSLQAELGNRWKLIAAQLPGRTPKRLGKWWDAFKDRQSKLLQKQQHRPKLLRQEQLPQEATAAAYDHILQTFAQKHVIPPPASSPRLPSLLPPPSLLLMSRRIIPSDLSLSRASGESGSSAAVPPTPTLSLATHTTAVGAETSVALSAAVPRKPPRQHQSLLLPPWMSAPVMPPLPSSSPSTGAAASACSAAAASCSPSVSLTLSRSSSGPPPPSEVAAATQVRRFVPLHQAASLAQLCMDLEEGQQAWAQHRKEAAWRLTRLEQQLESEKARRLKEVSDQVVAKIRRLREEEAAFLERLEAEYREQLGAIQREAEAKEAKMVEPCATRHTKLARLAEQVARTSAATARSHHHFTLSKESHRA